MSVVHMVRGKAVFGCPLAIREAIPVADRHAASLDRHTPEG